MASKKIALPAVLMMALTACMDGGGATVNKAATGLSMCADLSGPSSQYLQGNNVRCGPQTNLPYSQR